MGGGEEAFAALVLQYYSSVLRPGKGTMPLGLVVLVYGPQDPEVLMQ
jgi:hypothetical protein